MKFIIVSVFSIFLFSGCNLVLPTSLEMKRVTGQFTSPVIQPGTLSVLGIYCGDGPNDKTWFAMGGGYELSDTRNDHFTVFSVEPNAPEASDSTAFTIGVKNVSNSPRKATAQLTVTCIKK